MSSIPVEEKKSENNRKKIGFLFQTTFLKTFIKWSDKVDTSNRGGVPQTFCFVHASDLRNKHIFLKMSQKNVG